MREAEILMADLVVEFVALDYGQSQTIAVAVTELTVISVGKVFQCCPLKDVVWPPYWH